MSTFGSFRVEFSARRTLARLHEQIGAAGLAAAAAVPGLAAAVDQHSAAVRDILTFGVEGAAGVAGVVLLAGYAKGLLDRATENGWRPVVPADLTGWVRADWLTTRLLGVCALATTIDDPRYRLDDIDPLEPVAENG
ncbi:DUF6401 family natural product biosynthesis protein [Amycolatopsis arida]|uniref:DUF6401 family natural product biosynthesis protein n=1 Tax=Amycolatopsis arida TaxID=587909 RepID=UPI001FBA2E93|nr:DUF6401 family natural product biosynthesis protein [Amycolatopsis arida]